VTTRESQNCRGRPDPRFAPAFTDLLRTQPLDTFDPTPPKGADTNLLSAAVLKPQNVLRRTISREEPFFPWVHTVWGPLDQPAPEGFRAGGWRRNVPTKRNLWWIWSRDLISVSSRRQKSPSRSKAPPPGACLAAFMLRARDRKFPESRPSAAKSPRFLLTFAGFFAPGSDWLALSKHSQTTAVRKDCRPGLPSL